MDAPYWTQLEYDPRLGTRHGGRNCGPVTIAMALMAMGLCDNTRDAINQVADLARDGDLQNGVDTSHAGTNTHFWQLERAARHYGAEVHYAADYGEVRDALDAGKLVALLVHGERLAPRSWPAGWMHYPEDGHYVLACARDNLGNVQVNDPLAFPLEWTCVYTEASLEAATQGYTPLSLIFDGPYPQQPAQQESAPAGDRALESATDSAAEPEPTTAESPSDPDPCQELVMALTRQVGEISADRDRFAAALALSDARKAQLEAFAGDVRFHRQIVAQARRRGIAPVALLLERGTANAQAPA